MNTRKTHLKTRSSTTRLLKEMTDGFDDVFTIGYRPVSVARYGLDGVYRMRTARAAAERRAALHRLEKKKLIELKNNGNRYWAALTNSGIQEILRQRVMDADPLPEGKTCVVVFDVPEVQRNWRKALRRFLDRAGFIPMQKSVWISPFDATTTLRQLFASVSAWHWVKVFTAENF